MTDEEENQTPEERAEFERAEAEAAEWRGRYPTFFAVHRVTMRYERAKRLCEHFPEGNWVTESARKLLDEALGELLECIGHTELGGEVATFERMLAELLGGKHAVLIKRPKARGQA